MSRAVRDPLEMDAEMEAAARRVLMEMSEQGSTDGLGSQHGDDNEQAANAKQKSRGRSKRSKSQSEPKRKRKTSKLDAYQLRERGLYYVDPEDPDRAMRLSGRFEIAAITRTKDSEDWGRLIEWFDRDGKLHRWPCPMALLAGDGLEIRRRFLSGGLYVSNAPRTWERLANYIQDKEVETEVRCVDRIGWHGDCFVLSGATIFASGAEKVIYQTDAEPDHRLEVGGTADQWREQIGALCAGNSRLVLAASMAFACPLLTPFEVESGGVHLIGGSSRGKTSAQYVAGSVCGGGGIRGYLESWRATVNGLEATAAAHNDLLLVLDEIVECEAKDVAQAAYMLSNGEGKGRMTRATGRRPRSTWRLLYLSSGELTLSDHSASAGKRTRAGVEVRLLNIGADLGLKDLSDGEMGIFEYLHGCASGDALADLLRERALKFYGAPLRAFLERLVPRRAEILKRWREYRAAFVSEHIPKNASGEVKRAASRMALIAYAGQLATEWDLTGWEEDESWRAAGRALANWIETRGGAEARADDEAAIRKVRLFIEMHGASRFESARQRTDHRTNDVIQERIVNRAGFRSEDDKGEFDYWILPEVFRTEVCDGQDYRVVARALDKAGHLDREHPAFTRKPYIGALGMDLRVFAVKSSILES